MTKRVSATQRALAKLGKSDAEIARVLNERTGSTFERWDIRNWRQSGVPIRHALKLAMAADVDVHPLAPDAYPKGVVIQA